ncbi:MAG: hypothetical protein LAT51_12770 [Flavobacteriaceae bacterium]|nr:hypothetical protein [Flavobacteriaceae bacterium]
MKKIVIILALGLTSLSLSSFDTNTTKNSLSTKYEMFAIDCQEIAIQTYPVYHEQAGGDNNVAGIFAQASYDSCIRNGGSGDSWSGVWIAIRFAHPTLF